jgi:hypothetical protein
MKEKNRRDRIVNERTSVYKLKQVGKEKDIFIPEEISTKVELEYQTTNIWTYLNDACTELGQLGLLTGSPLYNNVFNQIEPQLKVKNEELYNKLKEQIEFNSQYEYGNFHKLR